ncbi:carboxylesterase/lipase family protein [Thioclava kandeliae]|uniref:Carboxylic ester hydrolase n=1 Tax=Thioclava kandeliae TaxID=3070818 RepID=A0ABV1SII8_9RHOB
MHRRTFLWSGTAATFAAAGAASAAPANAPPMAAVTGGQIRGERKNGLNIFRGIPYAAPPSGERRWHAPQPVIAWDGLRDATRFGAVCPQQEARKEPEKSLAKVTQDEDCLTLNIWAPEGAKDLPVMVWLHGGSFRFGAGSLALYHGQDLAPRGAVVVTINYRLGILGTFAHPALGEGTGSGGNFGLMDQIAALEWVRDNIAAFGGNPDNVTLFGESAGAVSVGYLLATAKTKGLIHHAIMQSGGLAVPTVMRDEAEDIGQDFAQDCGLDRDCSADDLRALPVADLLKVQLPPAHTMPFADGITVEHSLTDGFAHAAPVPLLIGWNTAEAGFFGPRYWQDLPQELGQDRYEAAKAACYGYGTQSEDAAREQIASEWFAGIGSRQIARTQAARAEVYAYRFGWVPPEAREETPGAIHTAEIPYAFGHIRQDGPSGRISAEMADDWVAFARDGSPASRWPAYKTDHPQMQLINAQTTIGTDPATELLDVLTAMNLPPKP